MASPAIQWDGLGQANGSVSVASRLVRVANNTLPRGRLMTPELDSLVRQFRDAQDVAVSTITETFKMPFPKSGPDWVRYCCDNGIQTLRELDGIPIYAHGYGIELRIGNLTIDFDWGPNGEPDGFDAWRLYNFTLDNETGIQCSHQDVIEWINDAYESGDLERVQYTYFDPTRRAPVVRDVDERSGAPKPPIGRE